MTIHYEQVDEHVARITIDRPEARNSLDLYHFRDLANAWRRFRDDDRRLGGDHHRGRGQLHVGRRPEDLHPADHRAAAADRFGRRRRDRRVQAARRHRCRAAQRQLYKPIIAAVNGPCVAGGMEMLGGVDIRIATERAAFGVMEPKRGLFAGGGTTVRLPQQIPFPAAMEFLLTAEAFPAAARPRARAAQRDRPERRAGRPSPRLGPPHHRQRTAGSAGHERVGVARDGRRHPERGLRHRERTGRQGVLERRRQGRAEGVRREARSRVAGPLTVARSAVDPRTPCIIGVGQRTVAPGRWTRSRTAGALGRGGARRRRRRWARRAGRRGARRRSTACRSSTARSWPYDEPVDRLAAALGIEPRHRHYSGIGGTTPQVLVQDTAAAILAGELDLAVIAGARPSRPSGSPRRPASDCPGAIAMRSRSARCPSRRRSTPSRSRIEVFPAWLTFPVFDIAATGGPGRHSCRVPPPRSASCLRP